MSFGLKITSKYDYQIIFRYEANFVLKRAGLAIMKQNVLNIELFKKCDITLQKQPYQPLSHFVTKIKRYPHLPCMM